nr:MAG TPA: hypothetical protein [Caudoviricetes sp.]
MASLGMSERLSPMRLHFILYSSACAFGRYTVSRV